MERLDLIWQVMKSRDNGWLEYSKKKVVGEPCEGKPHARFDVAGDGNQDMVTVLRHSQKKWRAISCLHLRLRRHPLTLPADVWNSTRFRSIFLVVATIGSVETHTRVPRREHAGLTQTDGQFLAKLKP